MSRRCGVCGSGPLTASAEVLSAVTARRIRDLADTVGIETEASAGELTLPEFTSARDDGAPEGAMWLDTSGNIKRAPFQMAPTVEVRVTDGISKLPAPVGGEIALVAGVNYLFEDGWDSAGNVLVPGTNTRISGVGRDICKITGTTATAVIRADNPCSITNIAVQQDGAGVALISNAGPGTVVDCSEAKFINGVDIQSGGAFTLVRGQTEGTSGIVLSGIASDIILEQVSMLPNFAAPGGSASFEIVPGGDVGTLRMRLPAFITLAGSIGIKVDSPTQVDRAFIKDSIFTDLGGGIALSGLTVGDDDWRFTDADGLTDSFDNGTSAFNDATPRTVNLPLSTAFVAIGDGGINIVYSLQAGAEKFALSDANTGDLVYNGALNRSYKIGAEIEFERVGGSNIPITFTIVKNGVPVGATAQFEAQNLQGTASLVPRNVALVFGDTVGIRIAGDGTGADITTTNVSVIASE